MFGVYQNLLAPVCAATMAAGLIAGNPSAVLAQADGPAIASVDVEIRGADQRQSLDVADFQFAVGDPVVICFTPSHDGFVSVWAKDPGTPDVTRLLPNPYAGVDLDGVAVTSGVEQCIGREGDGFSLRAQEPIGVTEITVAWTARADEQPTPQMFENPTAHAGTMALGMARLEVTR